MTTLLALDTATENCSVALFHQGETTFLEEEASRTHTQRILPMIDELLANAGLTLNQLDALVFGRGPGSFTGVRVGTGIVQGLAMGADLPVIGVSNLAAMAMEGVLTMQATDIFSAIDARMNEVYFTALKVENLPRHSENFCNFCPVIEEKVVAPQLLIEELQQKALMNEKVLRVGTGWEAYDVFKDHQLHLNSSITLPKARFMLPLALADYAKGYVMAAENIEPIYLRNQVTWKKLPHRE